MRHFANTGGSPTAEAAQHPLQQIADPPLEARKTQQRNWPIEVKGLRQSPCCY
jgi:hypothetical protein